MASSTAGLDTELASVANAAESAVGVPMPSITTVGVLLVAFPGIVSAEVEAPCVPTAATSASCMASVQ